MQPAPWIVIPTYNESANIERLVRALFALKLDNLHIVVVDDESPDGTSAIVRKLTREFSTLRVVTRKGMRGRGTAGTMGLWAALQWDASIVVEMDADFSHPPEALPALLSTAATHDIAIASRLAPGSHDKRPATRRWITHAANAYARAWLARRGQLSRIKDWTSGYRAYKRRVFDLVPPESLISQGPSVLQELLYRALCFGCTAAEVPFTMVDREAGVSTFSRKVALQSLRMIPRYRFAPIGEDRRAQTPWKPKRIRLTSVPEAPGAYEICWAR